MGNEIGCVILYYYPPALRQSGGFLRYPILPRSTILHVTVVPCRHNFVFCSNQSYLTCYTQAKAYGNTCLSPSYTNEKKEAPKARKALP